MVTLVQRSELPHDLGIFFGFWGRAVIREFAGGSGSGGDWVRRNFDDDCDDDEEENCYNVTPVTQDHLFSINTTQDLVRFPNLLAIGTLALWSRWTWLLRTIYGHTIQDTMTIRQSNLMKHAIILQRKFRNTIIKGQWSLGQWVMFLNQMLSHPSACELVFFTPRSLPQW